MSIDSSKYNTETPSAKLFADFKKLTKPPPVIYQPVESVRKFISKPAIDTDVFSDVAKTDAEKRETEITRMSNYINADVDLSEESKQQYPPENAEGRDKKTGKFSLPSIFKIVPIGINIFKKFPKVLSGLNDVVDGLRKLIINGVTTTADLVPSIFAYTGLQFMLGLIHTVCAVTNLRNLHICCIPYILDVIWWFIKLICCSIVNLLDVFIFKRLTGISLYDYVYFGFQWLSDNVHYPGFINELCYTCKHLNATSYNKMVTSKTNEGRHITKVITKDIPPRIIDPIRQEVRGFGKIASLFNI
jgi:hypothetical protein